MNARKVFVFLIVVAMVTFPFTVAKASTDSPTCHGTIVIGTTCTQFFANFAATPSDGVTEHWIQVDGGSKHHVYSWSEDWGSRISVTVKFFIRWADGNTWYETRTIDKPDCPPPVPPVCVISANPQSGNSPLLVNFDASASYDPDGHIVNFAWTFGDQVVGNGSVTSHTYLTPGSYEANVTVTDDDGESASCSETITVLPHVYQTFLPFLLRSDPPPFCSERTLSVNVGGYLSGTMEFGIWPGKVYANVMMPYGEHIVFETSDGQDILSALVWYHEDPRGDASYHSFEPRHIWDFTATYDAEDTWWDLTLAHPWMIKFWYLDRGQFCLAQIDMQWDP